MVREVIYNNDYLSLFSDGGIGISDGIGYIITMNIDEVRELYKSIL